MVEILTDMDVAEARREAAAEARRTGLDRYGVEAVAISVTELATNILRHAGGGHIRAEAVRREGRTGIEVEATDEGPGIADVAAAMQDSYSTAGSMGSGLPGVKRLMDDFEIDSRPGQGTRILVHKWA